MTNIVIIGAGIGGIPMAYEMKDLARPGEKVTVISNTPAFHFVPSNPWVAVGWRSREDISIDMAPIFAKKGIDFIVSGAKKVMPETKEVLLENGDKISYDKLVICTGPELAFDEIEGFGPEGHTESICHVDHAISAYEKWEAFCANPKPIVVGAVQGASCYGPAYEFAMILDTDLVKRKIRDKVPMTFVTSEPYVGHLGLGGVGDTKTLLESEMRNRSINFITNAKVDKVEEGMMHVTEVNDDGSDKKKHELGFGYAMMLPAFRGIKAVIGIEGLVNPRGFIIVDEDQKNPKYPDIYGVGVCIAIPPYEPTPVPVGVPKTGYMIESMVTAAAHNIRSILDDEPATHHATWNAICLADFGDSGVAFVAMPQIPPRNTVWASRGKWVHLAKVVFERYFLRKIRKGSSEPGFEKLALKLIGISRLRAKD